MRPSSGSGERGHRDCIATSGHLNVPRIAPLADHELSADQEEALKAVRSGTMGVLNIFRTLIHAPRAVMPIAL